ncbi:MAG: tetratricopeptide repeat protein [Pyrinomonadaceae bacterium]|nr:tetratricopeptide repeat protein [Pyrinomonadaceae bacterium]
MKYQNEYKSGLKRGAKNLAPVRFRSEIEELSSEILELEDQGRTEDALQLLAPYWAGIGSDPSLDGLGEREQALLLFKIGSVCSALGSAHQVEDSQSEARSYLSQADRLFIKLRDSENASAAKNKIGVSYWRSGKLEEAEKFLERAVAGAMKLRNRTVALANLAIVSSTKQDHYRAYQLCGMAIEELGESELQLRFPSGICHMEYGLACKNIAKTLKGRQREEYFDKAILALDEGLYNFEQVNNLQCVVSTQNNLGYLFYSLGDYERALEYLERAYNLGHELGEKRLIADVSDTLARCFIKTRRYPDAIRFSGEAVSLLRNFEHSLQLSEALRNQAVAFARNGERARALEAFEEARGVANFVNSEIYASHADCLYLIEYFDEINPAERQKAVMVVSSSLIGSQDDEVIETLRVLYLKLQTASRREEFSLDDALLDYERLLISEAVYEAEGNQTKAAKLLGISRQRLKSRIDAKHPDLDNELQHLIRYA